MFNPVTLKTASMRVVMTVYKDHWEILENELPPTLQQDVLTEWLYCSEEIEIDEDELNPLLSNYSDIDGNWCDLLPFTPQKFINLFTFREIPPDSFQDMAFYLFERENHVIWEYYQWIIDDTEYRRLCERCFIHISQFSCVFSEYIWLHRKWRFVFISDHHVIHYNDMHNYIKNSDSWCSNCIYSSLIKQVYNAYDCSIYENYHPIRRWRNLGLSSSSDEDDDSFNGAYMNPIRVNGGWDWDAYLKHKNLL